LPFGRATESIDLAHMTARKEATAMSTTDPAQATPKVRQYSPGASDPYYDDDAYIPGQGWVMFAGTMLALLAGMNALYGIAAVSNSTFFVDDAKYVLSGLNTWGWVMIAISVVQAVTAFGVWARWKGIRWVGVTICCVNALAQLIAMPAYPFWAMLFFAVDILVIFALLAHGGRDPH
jgi:hypothetical protein